jgi:hypothetical protein
MYLKLHLELVTQVIDKRHAGWAGNRIAAISRVSRAEAKPCSELPIATAGRE